VDVILLPEIAQLLAEEAEDRNWSLADTARWILSGALKNLAKKRAHSSENLAEAAD
jgi:hypothetical protein